MKKCTVCNQEKPFESFYKNKRRKDGYASACKVCSDEQNRQTRHKNPEKNLEHRRRSHNKRRLLMQDWKIERGCAHCGEKHPAVLELHHEDPNVKEFHPSNATSLKMFLEESEKCIVLCANCHRKEHYNLRRIS